MQSALKAKGVSASSVSVVSAVAAGKIIQSNSCPNGAINGICIGGVQPVHNATACNGYFRHDLLFLSTAC